MLNQQIDKSMGVLGIYGAGGLGRTLNDYIGISELKYDEIVFIDDTRDEGIFRKKRIMPFESFYKKFSPLESYIVIGVGEPYLRKIFIDRIHGKGYRMPVLFLKGSYVSDYATYGEGMVVLPGGRVEDGCRIGDNVIVMDNSIVGHDSCIGNNVSISSNVSVCGKCSIGDNVYIGVGSVLRDQINIGSNAVVGMGSVVMRDVQDGIEVAGNPARGIKKADGKVFSQYYHGII